MNIFEAFGEATAKYSAEELAVRTGVERLLMGMASIRSILCTCYGLWALERAYGHPDLIYSLTSYKARIMRALVGIGIFTEFGEETYSHNNLSRTLLNLTFRTLVIGMYVFWILSFASHNQHLPKSVSTGPKQLQ